MKSISSILLVVCLIATAFYSVQANASMFVDVTNEIKSMNFTALPASTCAKAASQAKHYASCGCPYVWGGTSCGCGGSGGMDCSGLVYTSYREAGYSGITRVTTTQVHQGSGCNAGCSPSNTHNCKVGDLFFYCFGSGCPDHVLMYVGGNQVAECSVPGTDCSVHAPYSENYQTCRSFC
ncbi:hypothetical protein CYY_010361 [Polysphondylium violaceum]|uniref:NlpC/P60 domain-containing protein n=1 Tax=Polysphondylium violaceum TaxID=133409 RepID=A0A8J4UZU4_9MYCE|nr:hypothetical protein CYY_010361 [Polysphondylium violaceum]